MDILQRQITDKAKQRELQAEAQRRFEEQLATMQSVIHNKEIELEKRRKIIQSDLNYYRCTYQGIEQRREFDLNDPNKIKNAKPIRSADNDINLGISSAQIFAGEDINFMDRRQKQRDQQLAWLNQQIAERRRAEEAREAAKRYMEDIIKTNELRLNEMAIAEKRIREEKVQAIRDFNHELARRKEENRVRKKIEKNEDDMAEIYNMVTSDMLTENPDCAQSRTNPFKKIAFMYRGMTVDELEKFRKEQNQQVIERNKKVTENNMMAKQWEQYALNLDHELMLKQKELEKKQKDELDRLFACNGVLAREQREQREKAKKQFDANFISDEFYDQFNRTTR